MSNSRSVIKGLKLKNQKGLNAQDIANEIEKGFLAKRRPDKDWVEKTTFAPSTIAYGHGTCARYWHIVFKGLDTYADNTDAMGVANMSLGSVFHDEIQDAMKHAGMLVEAEKEIKIQSPPIRGYLDAIVKIDGEDVVAEIKTTRQESFAFKELSGKPSANHLIQLLIYLKATGLQRGFLLYVNKNDQTFLVIPVELDEVNDKIIEDVFTWLRTVRKAFDDGQLAQIPFTRARNAGEPTNKICRGCPVQQTCFARSTEGDVFIPLMEVPKV